MEQAFLDMLRNASTPFLDGLFQAVTIMGEQIAIVAVIAFIYWSYDKKTGTFLVFSLCGSILGNTVVKGLVARPRPNLSQAVRVETATGYSFPSGHTQSITTFCASLWLWMRKWWVMSIGLAVSLLVGFSRLYLGVHFPTDVVGGFVFGCALSVLAYHLFQRVRRKKWLYGGCALLFFPFCIVFLFVPAGVEGQPDMLDFYKAYGLFLGFAGGSLLEEKLVGFSTEDLTARQRLRRYLPGILSLAVVYFGGKLLFPAGYLFALLRYGLLSFYAVFVYPFLFQKLKW